MLEFLLSGLLVLPAVAGSAWILERSYSRLECSRKAFERARTELNRAALTRDGVRVVIRCRTGTEVVFLPHLEKPSP